MAAARLAAQFGDHRAREWFVEPHQTLEQALAHMEDAPRSWQTVWAQLRVEGKRQYSYAEVAALAGVPAEGVELTLYFEREMFPGKWTWTWTSPEGGLECRVGYATGEVRAWPAFAHRDTACGFPWAPLPPGAR